MKSVLVTGGTVRIGKAISDRLASDGWRVVTVSHRADAGADIVADLSVPGGAEKLFAECKALLGGSAPDAIVNNAAIFSGDEEALARVNFSAPAELVDLAAASGVCGAAVNILDSEAMAGGGRGGYLASKRRLWEETLTAARRHAGVMRVNAVAPGPVFPPEGVHVKAPPTPFGRPAAEAVAEAVSFLLSAPYTTGAVVPVDGGAYLPQTR